MAGFDFVEAAFLDSVSRFWPLVDEEASFAFGCGSWCALSAGDNVDEDPAGTDFESFSFPFLFLSAEDENPGGIVS